VRIGAAGQASFALFAETWTAMVEHPDFVPGMNALWDLRSVGLGRLPSAEMRRMVEWASVRGPRRGNARVAILVGTDVDFGMARVAAAISDGQGVQMRVFREEAAAREWVA